LRMPISQSISGKSPRKSGVFEALRRSPLVGAALSPPACSSRVQSLMCESVSSQHQHHQQHFKTGPSESLLAWMAERPDEDLFIASLLC
jgi:hypothetical protein